MAQSFCNFILHGDKIALECKETCIRHDLIVSSGVANWETYIAKIGNLYEK